MTPAKMFEGDLWVLASDAVQMAQNAYKNGQTDEREECAKVCEAGVDYEHPTVKGHIMENFGHSRLLAKAIRARGQA